MTLHERTAYKAGYLESAMQALLTRLEYNSRENMAAFVKRSLERAEVRHG